VKLATVVGARPQFIKAAPVSRALAALGIAEVIIHTGQHFDDAMSDVFFRELAVPAPRHHLGIGGLRHGAMTGRMLERIEQVLLREAPDGVLVYGDTNSTLAGALAAAKLRLRVAHVEAGLRSFNRAMPEEINRVLTDHAADLLFAPTRAAVDNLVREGIRRARIVRSGDVMYDAAIAFGRLAESRSRVLRALGLAPRSYVLATVHRAENTDDEARLRAIFRGLGQASRRCPVVLPLHPRTRRALKRLGIRGPDSLRVIEPVGFLDMMMLEKNARLIATDSGGVQKEAYFHRVPCVTLREETEWVELVAAGANRLAPPRSARAVARALESGLAAPARGFARGGLYGKGDAAKVIAARLARWRPASRRS
jgi:UDP-GlcNAc3NAcA epimerase